MLCLGSEPPLSGNDSSHNVLSTALSLEHHLRSYYRDDIGLPGATSQLFPFCNWNCQVFLSCFRVGTVLNIGVALLLLLEAFFDHEFSRLRLDDEGVAG